MGFGRVVGPLTMIAVVATAAGCTSASPRQADAPGGPARNVPTARTSPVALPSLKPGVDANVLVSVPEQAGGRYTSAPLKIAAGDLRFIFTCTGGGTIRVELVPSHVFTHPCPIDSAPPYGDVITLSAPITAAVHVEADPNVRWELMVVLGPRSSAHS